MKLRLLGGLTAAQFMRSHWQKRPLFVRGALPGFKDPLSRRSLAALAQRDEVESRLVARRNGRWSVRNGPLSTREAARPGQRNWTMLVSGLNLHCDAADALLRRFGFLPQARLDDVMVSYAAPGGGVGPHVDSYDVFLLQGSGRRRWRVGRPGRYRLVEGSPLRQITGFEAEHEHIAERGDLLYLPPGWAHDGVALEPCFTYSIGFRAPEGRELGAAFLDWLHERGLPTAQYRDPHLAPARHPARIPRTMVDFAAAVLGRIRWSRRDVGDFMGRYLSAPKPSLVFRRARRQARPMAACTVRLDPRTQLLYLGARFFINGETVPATASDAPLLRELADGRALAGSRIRSATLRALILQWLGDGYMRLEPMQ